MWSDNQKRMEKWRAQSPETPGFHAVIVPGKNECRAARVYRLNLRKGESFRLESGELEMHPVLISGSASLGCCEELELKTMKKFDSFYIPANTAVNITADEDCVFYIGAAPYDGIGAACFRAFDPDLPIGDIHQIHGEGMGRREVMFTLDPATPASRLICGLTWSANGAWTSWPPHQHEKDLEEVYCYFDMPAPKFGFHVSYLTSGGTMDCVAHPVQSGTMVEAPCGYHPTVSSPVTVNAYLWILASFSPEQRRYDLAKLDPQYEGPK